MNRAKREELDARLQPYLEAARRTGHPAAPFFVAAPSFVAYTTRGARQADAAVIAYLLAVVDEHQIRDDEEEDDGD